MAETKYTSLSLAKKKREQVESMGKPPTLIVILVTYVYIYSKSL